MASSSTAAEDGPSPSNSNPDSSAFECNICLDTARDAVVSMCGHLFCWPCLHQWLETRPNRQVCPVCKAGISKEKVVPLYGRGSSNQQDPREKVPPRPAGQRSEPENNSQNFPGFGLGGDGLHFSFGIGAFPFSFFASTLNMNDGRPQPLLGRRSYHGRPNLNTGMQASAGTPQHAEEQFLSKIFLWVAVLFIFWLMIA